MGVPVLHDIYPAQFVHGGGPTTSYVNQLSNVEVSPGIEALISQAGGSLDPALIATAFADNKISFTSADVSTILGFVSFIAGLSITTSKIQWQKRASGGTYTGSGTHITLTSTGGLIYPKEINAKQDDKEGAQVTLDFCPTWDGTNLPVVVNVSQSLVGTPASNAVHALGPTVFEGAVLDGVQSFSAKSGIEVFLVRHAGELYARDIFIVKRAPMIEIELFNTPLAATPTLGATKALTGTFTQYLQKVAAGGTRVAIATAEHVSVGAAAGTYKIDSLGGSRGEQARTKLTIMPTGTLSFSAATAITLP